MEFINLNLILTINFVLVTTVVRHVAPVGHPIVTAGEQFCYDRDDPTCGPMTWAGVCQTGQSQSPIDLNYKRIGSQWGKTHIKFNAPYFAKHSSFFAANPGATFRVQFSDAADPTSDLYVTGAGLDGRYIFAQLHFHWSQVDKQGSEHALMGKRSSMEAHYVHYSAKYPSFATALDAGDADAVAVFAVLFEIGPHNKDLEPIIQAASSPESSVAEGAYVSHQRDLNIWKILPKKLDFVRYLGSLTTPPCTQAVSWTVFIKPQFISRQQLTTLRNLQNGDNVVYTNDRPLQPLNGRQLKFYKVTGGPIATVGVSIFAQVNNIIKAIWTGILNYILNLMPFRTREPVRYTTLAETLWSQNWLLNSITPMVPLFKK